MTILGLAACGASQPSLGPAPTAVVARVGSHRITGANVHGALEARQRTEAALQRLTPPHFTTCVTYLENSAPGGHPAPDSQLLGECRGKYRQLQRKVLSGLIMRRWLTEGARGLGVPTGTAVASEAIRRAVDDRVAPVTPAQVADYYRRHRFEFLAAGERDLRIARTLTASSSARVKAEVASGQSFASVVERLPVAQPINSHKALVVDLRPHAYGEPNLNEAIFTTAPGVLVGPIDTWFGYFVFEVTKVVSEHETPFRDVRAAIRRRLTHSAQARALADFTRNWRATWTSRTDCAGGEVVPGCRQSKGRLETPLEAPAPPS